jgi:hypothetical protein
MLQFIMLVAVKVVIAVVNQVRGNPIVNLI